MPGFHHDFLNSLKGETERESEDESDHQASTSQTEEVNPVSEVVEQIDLQREVEETETEAGGEQASHEEEKDQEAAAPLCDLGDKDTGPRQVKLNSYPEDSFGTQKSAFHHSWFAKYTWLKYSVNLNAAFCFPCRVFGKNIKHDALVSSGCRNWEKALSVFSKHDMTQSHKDSVVAWKGYQATSQQGDVVQMMMSANAHEIVARRDYLKRIVAVTSMLGAQGLPFRGHEESAESTSRGNFLACMELLMTFDPFLQNHNPPSNATYTLPVSQNEMVECCAQEVTSVIVFEITPSKMYSIMADEARDGRSEQLAVCVRYVSEGEVKERFLALSELMSFDAQSIADKLQEQLQINGLAHVKCVAQTYDGAAVMSGPIGGVQARFRRLHPEAIYIHCYAHELNLVLCHTCKAVTEAVELFALLESVYSFFTTSLVNHHSKFKDAQSRLGLAAVELVQLSNTRWACRLQSINAVLQTLPAIFECLSATGSPLAIGIKAKLSMFSTIYALLMFQTLLSITEGLHKLLQKETLDLAEALICKDAVCDTLKELFFPCLVAELDERFASVDTELLKGIQACSPKSETFLNEVNLKELAGHYITDLKTGQVLVARNFIARKADAGNPSQDMLAVYNLLYTDMFPSLKEVLQVALTVPKALFDASTHKVERKFGQSRSTGHTDPCHNSDGNGGLYLTLIISKTVDNSFFHLIKR
ncbi:zinc finger MYM-type protein 1-like [Penaeus indicus]|uniref:zinc finger MYM-type protein 1-like n=1 Tax=Penaeus indicus TaxID=29960 RepID=UPI00300D0D65